MLAGWPVGLYLTVMEPRGIYRERKGLGNQDSARVLSRFSGCETKLMA